jgi:hypothetical protein
MEIAPQSNGTSQTVLLQNDNDVIIDGIVYIESFRWNEIRQCRRNRSNAMNDPEWADVLKIQAD